ncbi:hypothetical protein [Methylobacterium nigriterrae]|uniref:ATP-binding protein n=1 Tax=Methylobacterium nigriterrae TaxID=3127512 RepID=UPI0030140E42
MMKLIERSRIRKPYPAPTSNAGPGRPLRVVLLSPPGDLGLIVLRCLGSLGAKTFLVCEPRSAIRFSSYAAGTLVVREGVFEDPRLIADAINAADAQEPVDVVIASTTAAARLLAGIRDRIRPAVFPIPDLATLATLDHKHSFARLCGECGVPTPRTLFYASPAAVCVATIRDEIGYPCVVKPVGASGGEGVSFVARESDLAGVLAGESGVLDGGLLVQRFMPGNDVGLSVFAVEGEIRHWTTFYCDGYWSTRFVEIPELLAAGRRLVEHTRYTGVANFDARRSSATGELTFLECNPRFFRRVDAARQCGLDFVAAGLVTLGLAAPEPETLTRGCHLAARDLVLPIGLRMVLSGAYPLGAVRHDAVEFLKDPAPVAGSAFLELFRHVLGKLAPRRTVKVGKCPNA